MQLLFLIALLCSHCWKAKLNVQCLVVANYVCVHFNSSIYLLKVNHDKKQKRFSA